MSHHRDSPTATADGRSNPRDLPGSAAGPGSAASVKAACSAARSPARSSRSGHRRPVRRCAVHTRVATLHPACKSRNQDEEVFVHPRDPFVRVDALQSSRHVRVERNGHLLAESDSPIMVFETGLPTRYYLPERDVDPSLLADSDLQTGCPYKGFASYRDVLLNGRRHRSLFWSYQAPFREVTEIKGYLAPYNERVDLIIDGHPQERPAGPLGPRAEPSTPAA
jgi:uncharacterized protein (DUF427 family)